MMARDLRCPTPSMREYRQPAVSGRSEGRSPRLSADDRRRLGRDPAVPRAAHMRENFARVAGCAERCGHHSRNIGRRHATATADNEKQTP